MKTVTHKLLITIMAVLLVISVAFTFVACAKQGEKGEKGDVGQNGADGVGIADVKINKKGQLVITYTDGKVQIVGDVVGKDGKDGKSAYEISDEYLHGALRLLDARSRFGKNRTGDFND